MKLHHDPTLAGAEGYDTFGGAPRQTNSSRSLWASLLFFFVAVIAVLSWNQHTVHSAMSSAYTQLGMTRGLPAIPRYGQSLTIPKPAIARAPVHAIQRDRETTTVVSKREAPWWGNAFFKPKANPRWSPMKPTKNARVKSLMAWASGLALVLTAMSPEVTQAATDMVDSQYLTAVASSMQGTVHDISGLLQTLPQTQNSPEVGALVESVTQVYKTTIHNLGALADGGIGDIPKEGWFDKFVHLIENSILGLNGVLSNANVPGSLGVSITLFTMAVKAILLPVNFAQLKSSTQMQAIQPKVKEIQERFAEDKNTMNIMLAELYAKNEVNPLLAIVPAFAQIPIFIGLYRALRELGQQNLLDEPFLWIPSLEGPTFDLQTGHTLEWLTQHQLSNSDTLAYLSIPALLIVTQTLSTQLSKQPDGPETPTWIYFLPLLTASFALNVPSGLAVYWIVNTVVTAGTNIGVRKYLENDPSIKAAAETDIDSLSVDSAKREADMAPSYQEALLRAVDKDAELSAAFAEMRQSPKSVMKYYGDREFTGRLADLVAKEQEIMLEEQQKRKAELDSAPKIVAKKKEDICVAVRAGNMTGVKDYLAAGVDPNFKDEKGISALHYAVGKGRMDMAKLLVKEGADVNIRDFADNSLLHYAAGYGRENMIKFLHEQGVDFNALNANKESPLDLATNEDNSFSDEKCAKLLRKYGAEEGLAVGPLAPEVLDEKEARAAGRADGEVQDAEFTEVK
mmetsp:Transcript_12599/g.22902  ORF Transcript_12599/g.22902 Transcript_12599/m.22902 type:complete len:738 (+) Transcript_12599:67-2280(+)